MLRKPWDIIPERELESHLNEILVAKKDLRPEELAREVKKEIINLTEEVIDFNFLVNNTHEIPACIKHEIIEILHEYQNKIISSLEFQVFLEKKIDLLTSKLDRK